MSDAFRRYRRKQFAELRPYVPGEDMTGISISVADKEAGSPKAGDMIARNPQHHNDRWLIAADYAADNFEAADALAALSATRSAIRREALEEAAKLADAESVPDPAKAPDALRLMLAEDAAVAAVLATKKAIAASIRSLADKEPQA